MGLLDKFLGFVNGDSTNAPKESSPAPTTLLQENVTKQTEIEDVETFLTELYQYYANDIYRLQAKIIDPEASQDSDIGFLSIMARQKEEALKKIKVLLAQIIKDKKPLTELERKSSYTFYEQLKADTQEKVKITVFKTFAKIKSINVASELDEIIVNKLNKVRADWKISPSIEIPDIADFRIIDITENLEIYSFGDLRKEFIITGNEVKLSDEDTEKIDNLTLSLPEDLPDYIWIQSSLLERWQIDLLQKTAVFPNTYEANVAQISYDIISKSEIENYIKGMLKILLSKGRYIAFSIILPDNNIKNSILGFVTTSKRKIMVENIAAFMLYERNKIEKTRYYVKYLDRYFLPDTLNFKMVDDVKYEFLPQYIDY